MDVGVDLTLGGGVASLSGAGLPTGPEAPVPLIFACKAIKISDPVFYDLFNMEMKKCNHQRCQCLGLIMRSPSPDKQMGFNWKCVNSAINSSIAS